MQSILDRFGGAEPAPRDQVTQYLTRRSSKTSEEHARSVLEELENEGYIECISGEQGEELVRFPDKAVDEVFD